MKVCIIYILAIVSPVVLSAHFQADEPNSDKIALDINMAYFRNLDGSVTLRAEVYDEEEYEAVTNLEFVFYSIGKEKEDYFHQMFLKCSCSLILVLAILALGICRTWRAEPSITYNDLLNAVRL